MRRGGRAAPLGRRLLLLPALLLALFLCGSGGGGRFRDHGAAAPQSTSRGTVATVDGAGRKVVLGWLYDHRGGYALLLTDVASGKSEQFPVPFAPEHDGPYASLLSSRNRLYTHFAGHFIEFDVARRAFTFWRKTSGKSAMSMTEDDGGGIWAAVYPGAGLVRYHPGTGSLRDYGPQHRQNWEQYPRWIAADDQGWIYFALGFTLSQVVAFDPVSGASRLLLPEAERKRGMAYLYRDLDGRVYARALEPSHGGWYPDGKASLKALQKEPGGWLQLHRGKRVELPRHDRIRPKEAASGNQNLVQRSFPDGSRLAEYDLALRRMSVEEAGGKGRRTARLDYRSDGAHIMTVSAAPDGTVFGATTFPSRLFVLDRKSGRLGDRECYGQWNTVANLAGRVFVGGYPGGFLLEWDPSRPWQPAKEKPGWNPRYLCAGNPVLNRPADLLPLPDGSLVLAGTPEYGHTGGGLLFWEPGKGGFQLKKDGEVVPGQSSNALLLLPGNRLLGGTTTAAGTGGERKGGAPELYLMDLATRKVLWRQPVFPTLQEVTDLCQGPGGVVYGMMNRGTFFVFDPAARKVLRQETSPFGLSVWHQGPRVFVPAPDGTVYILFKKGIAKVDPAGHRLVWLADSPVPVSAGGVYQGGRIYFAGGDSHLYSFEVNAP